MGNTATPKQIVAFLTQQGFVLVRQRGSHAIYRHENGHWTVVPMHTHDLPQGTLRGILKRAGYNLADFVR